MASGVPTVAFDYGAAREHLRDGLHGAAIADGDDAGFIAAAARIGSDDGQRMAMAVAGRAAVGGLRPAQVAADFDTLLQELSRAPRSTARLAMRGQGELSRTPAPTDRGPG
jgi:glycosyltransferase involved in cell wall biosynthesis